MQEEGDNVIVVEEPPPKKLKPDDNTTKEEEKAVVKRLEEYLDKHDKNRITVQDALISICSKLKKSIEEMETSINSELEEKYRNEDDRFQEMLAELNKAIHTGANDTICALVSKAKAALLVTQSYKLAPKEGNSDFSLCGLETKRKVKWDRIDLKSPTQLKVRGVASGLVNISFTSLDSETIKVLTENGHGNKVSHKVLLNKKYADGEGNVHDARQNSENGSFSFQPDALEPEAEYEVRVKVVCNDRESEWSNAAYFIAPEYTECCAWKEYPNPRNYSIDKSNPRIVKKIGRYINDHVAVGNIPIPPGRVTSWNVKLLDNARNGKGIYVGVRSVADGGFEEYFGCYTSDLYSGKPELHARRAGYGLRKDRGKYVSAGDSVGVIVDMTKGELSFALNGVTFGVARKDIPLDEPLVPCVYMRNPGTSVKFEPWNARENVCNSVCVPTNVVATETTCSAITLSWKGTVRGTFYQVETNGSKSWDSLKGCIFKKTNLQPNTEYTFRVRAVKKNQISKWSDTLSVRTSMRTQALEDLSPGDNEGHVILADDDMPVSELEEDDNFPSLYDNYFNLNAVMNKVENINVPQYFPYNLNPFALNMGNNNVPQSFPCNPNPPALNMGMNGTGNNNFPQYPVYNPNAFGTYANNGTLLSPCSYIIPTQKQYFANTQRQIKY